MTHAEKLSGRRHPGLPPSSCPGELAPEGLHADHVLAEGGHLRQRAVAVWHCLDCGSKISESEGEILNAYRPPPPKDVARRLAGDLDARKGGFLP